MRNTTITRSQLRSFGLIVSAGFAVIAVWPMAFRGLPARTWAVIVAAVLATMALCAPSTLRSFHRVWMSLGETLGWVNSRILLTVTYYLVILPIGLIRRFGGDDPLRRTYEPDANTYKETRSVRPPSHMRHQY
jgi:hypothetical protein